MLIIFYHINLVMSKKDYELKFKYNYYKLYNYRSYIKTTFLIVHNNYRNPNQNGPTKRNKREDRSSRSCTMYQTKTNLSLCMLLNWRLSSRSQRAFKVLADSFPHLAHYSHQFNFFPLLQRCKKWPRAHDPQPAKYSVVRIFRVVFW